MKTTTGINGAGIGLRSAHYQAILENQPAVRWFEALTDNYMGAGGLPLYHLEQIRNHYPITFHGVGLSLGSTDPLNTHYLQKLKHLIQRFEPEHISDHLAWVSVNQHYTHELLPFPYTEEAVDIIASKINQVQDFLGQPLIVENPSTYLSFRHSEKAEWEFIQDIVKRTGCYLLMDVNNIYVSAQNNGFDANTYLANIPAASIKEIHLAGYEDRGNYLYDTHGYRIHDSVWQLYTQAITCWGEVPTLIEWDNDLPTFEVLQQEAAKAQQILNTVPAALEQSA